MLLVYDNVQFAAVLRMNALLIHVAKKGVHLLYPTHKACSFNFCCVKSLSGLENKSKYMNTTNDVTKTTATAITTREHNRYLDYVRSISQGIDCADC